MKRFYALALAWLLAGPMPAFAGPADPGPAQSQSALVGCKYNSSGVTLSDQDQAALQCTSDGKLITDASVSASVAVDALTSTNLGSTIAVTNTFQSIQALTAGRKGCLIQNQSTSNTMWVFFGPIASATKATSFMLDSTHGLSISCAVGGLGVVTDQVSITGTATDAFNASFQ